MLGDYFGQFLKEGVVEGVGLVEMVSRGAVMNLEIHRKVCHPLSIKFLSSIY